MSPGDGALHADALAGELDWLERVVCARTELMARGMWEALELQGALSPPVHAAGSALRHALDDACLGGGERVALGLALAARFRPEALDLLLVPHEAIGRRFTQFGGGLEAEGGGLKPTRQTALFLLAARDLRRRLELERRFHPRGPLFASGLLERGTDDPGPDGPLRLSEDGAGRLAALDPAPHALPATNAITTPLGWDEMVLEDATRAEIEHILAWARHEELVQRRWGLSHWLKPGYRALFYGPPGTGKTLAAALIGKVLGRSVLRVDLSQLISKYIGETEKGLARLFDETADDRAILFFDEADSLFGRRVEANTSNDRALNQEVGYLLQRMEDHPGLMILATNLRGALDPAFARRFQGVAHFPMPGRDTRRSLWSAALEEKPFRLAEDVDIDRLARDHEVSGGEIVNILHFASLRAAGRPEPVVVQGDLVQGLRREMHKAGRLAVEPGALRNG